MPPLLCQACNLLPERCRVVESQRGGNHTRPHGLRHLPPLQPLHAAALTQEQGAGVRVRDFGRPPWCGVWLNTRQRCGRVLPHIVGA
jgi:hypothetical protein